MKKYLTLSFVSIFVILTISYLINNNNSFITKLFSRKNIKIETNDFPLSNDFVFPQPSNDFSPVSQTKPHNPLYEGEIKKPNDNKITIIRSSNLDNDNNPIYYKPDYYKSDFIDENPIDSTEYSHANFDSKLTTINAWEDENISQHPKFYRSEITDEKTNLGKFFDENLRFHDRLSNYSTSNLPDRCMLDKNNNIVCDFNNKLQNIPPSLIQNNIKNDIFNKVSIGNNLKNINDINISNVSGNNYSTYSYENEKPMNGGEIYKGVNPSNSKNESYLNLNSIDNIKNISI